MVSPHKTGKTLAYLLPLITLITEQSDSGFEVCVCLSVMVLACSLLYSLI